MRALTLIAVTVCAGFGSSCGGGGTEPGTAIDHLEIHLVPSRASYPVPDTVRAYVTPLSRGGTWLPPGPTTWRSLTPALASVEPDGLIHTAGHGEATIEVAMDGVTARVAIPIRGVLHTGYDLNVSQTWSVVDTPHVVERALNVGGIINANAQDTAVLTIEPGVTVRFRPGAGLAFGGIEPGALVIPAGGDPVIMEEDPTSPPSPNPSWLGLSFARSRSQLRNLRLRHCGHDYPFSNPGACVIVNGGEVLIDGVTISGGHNGLNVIGTFTPGSRDLSIESTDGYVATIIPDAVESFPRGGHFTGNAGSEILITNGVVRRSTTWSDPGLPLRLTGAASFDGPGSPVLTLPAGFRLRADPRAALSFPTGSLVAGDPAGAPVIVESTGDGWGGINLAHSGGSALRNVVLRDCGLQAPACLVLDGRYGEDTGLVAQDLTIRGARSAGVRMALGGHFNAASRNLTIAEGAGVPIDASPETVSSIPTGDYRFNGIDAIRIRVGAFWQTTTLRNLGVPYLAPDGIGVSSSTDLPTLTLEPGVTIQVGLGKTVSVGIGTLLAIGTPADPVRFASVTPGVAGSWMGVELGTYYGGTRLEYVEIADAGAGPSGYAGALRLAADPGGLLHNSTVRRSPSCGIILFNGQPWTDDYTDPAFGNTFVDVVGLVRCQPPS